MLKKSLFVLGLAAPLLFTQPATAENRSFGEIYTECGLGGLIGSAIDNKSAGQIVAIISNITWDLGTTAISSQLSSPDTCASDSGAVAAYINHAYDVIEQDLASGNGQHLDMLKTLTHSDDTFNATLRAKFAEHVSNPQFTQLSRYEKAEALYDLVIAVQ